MTLLVASGIGVGWGMGTTVSPGAPPSNAANVSAVTATTATASKVATNASASAGPYQVTLVEVMANTWNSSAPLQPKIFVMGSHGLESSANIVLPAHRLIQLTIVAYDAATPNSTEAMAKVTGTVGGNIYTVNGTLGSGMTNDSMDAMTAWGQNATLLPVSSLTGTLTIPQLGINIPFDGMSTTVAYLDFNQKGTYTWVCLTPCGLGKDGLSGAMDTPGWMMGSLTVG